MHHNLTTEQASKFPILLQKPVTGKHLSRWGHEYVIHGPNGFVLPNDEKEAAKVREELIEIGVPKKDVGTLVSARELHEMLFVAASAIVNINVNMKFGTKPYTTVPWVEKPAIMDDPAVFRTAIGMGNCESEASAHKAADIMRYALVRNEQLRKDIDARYNHK
jgi:hypothetical protein